MEFEGMEKWQGRIAVVTGASGLIFKNDNLYVKVCEIMRI
jgi:hypothetical protein